MVNQSCIKATRNAPRYKFGYRIPCSYSKAMQFDLKNGNTLWREATNLEMLQLVEYDTFRDLGHKATASPPTGYKKIHTHLVYDCKHDSRHKARMVADGHLTDIPLESVCTPVTYPYEGYESLPSFPSSMVLSSGLPISVMLIWKPLPWNGIILLQALNLVNWKDII
jgi:hypothetical protein